MKWFRSNTRLGSQLALFALAIQFLLSFGHFHGGVQAAAAKLSGVHDTFDLAASRTGASERASPAVVVVGSKRSADHGPAGHPGDECAICAVMALANAMVDAAPPALSAPHAIAFSYSQADAGFLDWNAVSRAFQPRAPPVA